MKFKIDRHILRALAEDLFAAAIGVAVFGLPVMALHNLVA
jgi:hypothetical protein